MSGEVEITSPEDFIPKLQKLATSASVIASHIGLNNIPKAWMLFQQITSLDLSSNPVDSVNILWDCGPVNLHKLNLSACWLTQLPYGPPAFFNTLSEFYLDGNFLSRDPPNFSVFPHLKKLSIIGNDFSEIPILPRSLEVLIYRMNSFSAIPDCGITTLDASYCNTPNNIKVFAKQLSYLDLSHGTLAGDITLPSIPLLSQINLSHNSITSINFEGSRRLTEVDLSYNGLESIPEILYNLPMLRILKLQHNVISEIDQKTSTLRRLEYLDISHNSIFTGKISLPDRLKDFMASFNIFLAFSSFPLSLETFDASFCKCLVIPSSIHKMKSLSLFFVNKIYFSQPMLSIKFTSGQEIPDGAKSEGERLIPITSPPFPEQPLLNDSLGNGIGCSATLGRSTKFEDNFMCLKHGNALFVGVFDGHAGHESALISAECFTKILPKFDFEQFATSKFNPKTVKNFLRKSFAEVNDELRNRKVKDGTTAVVVCLHNNHGAVAHVGDSLALLVGHKNSKLLTKMHRPTDKDEFSNLRKKNMFVSSDWRVDGKLSVSRSLGDFWCCGGMYDDADVAFFDLDEDSLSLVLGCDGLWDYVDEGTVCSVVRELRDPVKAAKLLQDIAFASGSHDSISVIVVNVDNTTVCN